MVDKRLVELTRIYIVPLWSMDGVHKLGNIGQHVECVVVAIVLD